MRTPATSFHSQISALRLRRAATSLIAAARPLVGALALAVVTSSLAIAQAPPARETPSPQDIDPAVDTSAAPAPPAREAPRPQDIDPAVDTSAPRPSDASPPQATPSGAATNASADATAAQSARPAARGGRGQDRLELDTTQITGNRELPKVLYIVPWKRSDLGDLVGKPVNSLLDEVLTPVDRDVFKRENRYFRALTPGADEGAGMPLGEKERFRPPSYGSAPAAGSAGSAEKAGTGSSSTAPPAGNER
jgi:hypothetical protein